MKLEKKQQGKIYFIDIWRFKSASLFLFALVSSDASEELVSLYDYDVKIKIRLISIVHQHFLCFTFIFRRNSISILLSNFLYKIIQTNNFLSSLWEALIVHITTHFPQLQEHYRGTISQGHAFQLSVLTRHEGRTTPQMISGYAVLIWGPLFASLFHRTFRLRIVVARPWKCH